MSSAHLFYGFKIHQNDITGIDTLNSDLIIKYPYTNAIAQQLKNLGFLKLEYDECKCDKDFRNYHKTLDELSFGCELLITKCGIYSDLVYYIIIKVTHRLACSKSYGTDENIFNELITNEQWQIQLDNFCDRVEIPKQKGQWILTVSV